MYIESCLEESLSKHSFKMYTYKGREHHLLGVIKVGLFLLSLVDGSNFCSSFPNEFVYAFI